ncbi:MAG: hypothetical protein ACHQPI_04420 [Thermoanaerobaculia bacterium]
MSARPDLVRLSDEDLDLLLSRSLDGDLSPEEEQQLENVLASDPRAARRREELSTLVEKLNALPDPAPPLGLTARTNAWTAERGQGIGAVWHRLGLFPPPTMLRGIGALFVIVLIGMSVLKTQSVRQKAAESVAATDEGRVAIFFGERGPSSPAAKSPSAPSAPSAPPAPARAAVTAAPSGNAPLQKSKVASAAPPSARRDAQAVAESAGAIGGVPAPPARAESAFQSVLDEAAPAGASAALRSARTPFAWDVTVADAFVRGWALRRVAAIPPSAVAPAVSYRITLDAEGKVVSARALSETTAERDAAVRSLVFQKLAANAPAEIEITLAAR